MDDQIFYFDDDFDEGQLDRDPVAAEKEIRHTLAVLEEGAEIPDRELHPLRYLFRTIWDRVKEVRFANDLFYCALLIISVRRGLILMSRLNSRSRTSDTWTACCIRWKRHAMETVNLGPRRTTSECGGGLLVGIHASVSSRES